MFAVGSLFFWGWSSRIGVSACAFCLFPTSSGVLGEVLLLFILPLPEKGYGWWGWFVWRVLFGAMPVIPKELSTCKLAFMTMWACLCNGKTFFFLLLIFSIVLFFFLDRKVLLEWDLLRASVVVVSPFALSLSHSLTLIPWEQFLNKAIMFTGHVYLIIWSLI